MENNHEKLTGAKVLIVILTYIVLYGVAMYAVANGNNGETVALICVVLGVVFSWKAVADFAAGGILGIVLTLLFATILGLFIAPYKIGMLIAKLVEKQNKDII